MNPTSASIPAVAGLVEHVAGGGPSGPPPGLPVLSTLAAYVAVAGAGLLVAPLLTRVAVDTNLRRALLAVVGTAHVALLAAILWRGDGGVTRSVVALLATAFGAVAVARRSTTDQAIAGGLLLAVQTHAMGTDSPVAGTDPLHLVAISLHLGAAAVWLGGVLHLATFLGARPDRPALLAAARRFTGAAVVAGFALAGTGALLVVIHRIPLGALPTTGFGRVVLTKTFLLLAAGALGVAHRFGRPGPLAVRRLRLLRVEAGALAVALGFAVVLAELPDPHSPVEVLRPGLALVQPSGAPPVSLFAVATSTGSGAVQLGSAEPVQLIDRVTGRSRQVAPGQSVPVVLRDGRVDLGLVSGTSTVDVRLTPRRPATPPAGEAVTADVAGWTAYQLGRTLADGSPTTLVASSRPCDRGSTRATGAALAARLRADHVNRVYAVSDGSERARQLLRGVAGAGVKVLHRPGPAFVLLATGTDVARQVIGRLARAAVTPRGIYLAPWLLDGSVLATLTSARVPPVLVASTVDPLSPTADRYRAALSAIAPGVTPSAAGLRGYLDGTGAAAPGAMQLYAAAPIGFLPGALEAGHDDHRTTGWFAHGSVVATAPPAPLPSCTPDPSGES